MSRNYTDCTSVNHGLFLSGLHAAVQYFVRSTQDVVLKSLSGSFANLTVQVTVTQVLSLPHRGALLLVLPRS